MITVISGTNRLGSKSKIVAERCYHLIQKHVTGLVKFYSLEDLPSDLIHSDMYKIENMNKELIKQQDEYFLPADKFVFVIPEYNGGVPGVFKLFIDAISFRNYKGNFNNKKVFLIGVSAGKSGNLRGLDYLTNAFQYMNMNVFPIKVPLSSIQNIIDENNELNQETIDLLDEKLSLFADY